MSPNAQKTVEPSGGERGEKKRRTIGEIIIDLIFDTKVVVRDAFKWLLFLFEKRPALAAAMALALTTALLLGRLLGYDILYFIPPKFPPRVQNSAPLLRDASWIQDFYKQRACISRAKSLSKPYVLLHVIQWLQYEDDPDGSMRRVHERIFYTLLPLRQIKGKEQVFLEEYSGSHVVKHWFSPRREVFIGGGNKYQVVFEGHPGIPVSLTTGAEFEYKLPLDDGRTAFREQVTVNHGQDFWYYQNIDDVICLLSQTVESTTLQLRPVGAGGKRVGIGSPEEGEVVYQPTNTRPMTNSSISMIWKDVMPGEDVGLVFSW